MGFRLIGRTRARQPEAVYSHIENATFNTTGGAPQASNTCGIYTQGAWILYGLTVDHASFLSEVFSVVQGTSEINSYYGGFGDFQDWNHLNFTTVWYPWISYNGGEGRMSNVEITANAGPQFLSLSNNYADITGWNLNIQEMETWSRTNDTRFGLRLTGLGSTIHQSEMSISADSTNKAWIDATNTTCYGCFADAGGINLFGSGNAINAAFGTPLNNQGKGNSVTNYYNASLPSGIPAPAYTTLIPQKGLPNLLGASEPDFADGRLSSNSVS